MKENWKEYIRKEAKKLGLHKYFSSYHVGNFIFPCGIINYINYDMSEYIEIGKKVIWAEVYYNRELTEKELADYELIKG